MKQPPDPATRISKRLSFILRHQPQSIGITLDAQGWTDVAILLQQLNAHGTAIDRALLDHVVATNPKQRFSYDTSGTKIRANQGHSVAIDLAYTPCVPPETLYHGTARSTFAAIRESGARIVSYGAPVLPGAMMLLAYAGDVPIAGLPGCVMYAKRTVFDRLLPRILARDPITVEDIALLGEGGLCP